MRYPALLQLAFRHPRRPGLINPGEPGCQPETWNWYFPVARRRHKGVVNLQPHMNESTLNYNIAAMPGVRGALSRTHCGARLLRTARNLAD